MFLSLVAFFVYLIYIVVFKDINKQKNFLNSQIEILEKEKQVLEDENETLQEGIMLAFQEEYLEQEARINAAMINMLIVVFMINSPAIT